MSVHDCHLIEIEQRGDARGMLSFLETELHIPFEVKRVYYLYDIVEGVTRGDHAH